MQPTSGTIVANQRTEPPGVISTETAPDQTPSVRRSRLMHNHPIPSSYPQYPKAASFMEVR